MWHDCCLKNTTVLNHLAEPAIGIAHKKSELDQLNGFVIVWLNMQTTPRRIQSANTVVVRLEPKIFFVQ